MIISADNSSYKDLFTKAYNLLKEEGKIQENAAGRLTSLEEFFSYIQDIVQLDDRYLIRLPIEEPTLAINANKRTIDTSLFNKCITVQSDQIAEILVFSIDRYFDYKDLADEKVQIWVQWIAGGQEGATYISLKDTETEKGKLRFGWPLDNVVTAKPGNVQFAVRFFMKDDVEEFDAEGNSQLVNKIVYSLNTLPATLSVKAALNPELNDDTAVHRPHGLFTYAVRNSLYAGEDVQLPQVPTFDAPGSQLPMTATLKDNTLTLSAQAVSGDAGTIAYKWYYKPVGEKIASEIPNNSYKCTTGMMYKVSYAKERVLSDDYFSNSSVTTDNYADTYYAETPTGAAFTVYTGEVKYEEMSDGSFKLVTSTGLPLYEKYTYMTVPASGSVTGTYTVKAWNSTAVAGKVVTSELRESRECVLVSPTDIIVVNDLAPYALITELTETDKETGEVTTTVVPASLNIGLSTVENDQTVFKYEWKMSKTKSDSDLTVDSSSTGSKLNTTTPGWYKVYITADLNRQTNEHTSGWSKVTNMPTLPIATATAKVGDSVISVVDPDDVHAYDVNAQFGAQVALTVDAYVDKAGEDPSKYDAINLYSEGLTYDWTLQISDDDERALTNSDITDGNLKSNSITVLNRAENGAMYTYKCTVSNVLNEQVAKRVIEFRVV